MGVQRCGGTASGCTHAFDVYPDMSDAAISHEPASPVCEVMVLPHPVIARSGSLGLDSDWVALTTYVRWPSRGAYP